MKHRHENILPDTQDRKLERDSYIKLNGVLKNAITIRGISDSFDGEIVVPYSPESVAQRVIGLFFRRKRIWYSRLSVAEGL